MIGTQDRWQGDLFVVGSLQELIPEDHILRRVDRVLDLDWLREEVNEFYCEENGRPSIDPQVAVRLMLAGFLLGIAHDRKLLREAQVNLAIRWFAGYKLHEALPDHSSLTRIRQRWGEKSFHRIFGRTVRDCLKAGIAKGDVVHIDATLIRADVSWDSLVKRHVDAVEAANGESGLSRSGTAKRDCTTDPDVSLAKADRRTYAQPCYKQHTAVDDQVGVVLDVLIATGETNEGDLFEAALERVATQTGRPIDIVTADAGYAYAKVYACAEKRGVKTIVPTKAEPPPKSPVPLRRFKYDARHEIVRCPAGQKMYRSARAPHGWFYRALVASCRQCHMRTTCLPRPHGSRSVVISDGYDALLRARRHRPNWSDVEYGLYQRHRWRIEGAHAEAKGQHGLRRAVRRRMWNMAIQAYLAAAAMNLKRLATAFLSIDLELLVVPIPSGNAPTS